MNRNKYLFFVLFCILMVSIFGILNNTNVQGDMSLINNDFNISNNEIDTPTTFTTTNSESFFDVDSVKKSVPSYLIGSLYDSTEELVYAEKAGLLYEIPNRNNEPLDSGNLSQDENFDHIISVIPYDEVYFYLDDYEGSGDLDLLLYEGDEITGPPIATSTNEEGSNEWISYYPTNYMNLTIRIIHDSANSTKTSARGILYYNQYTMQQGIYRVFMEGKNPITGLPYKRTQYGFPHITYEGFCEADPAECSGIYAEFDSNLDMYQIREYHDYTNSYNHYFGEDLAYNYVDEAPIDDYDMLIDADLPEGFTFDLEAEWGGGFVTLGIDYHDYNNGGYTHKSDNYLQWCDPQFKTFNSTKPVFSSLITRFGGEDETDYISDNMYFCCIRTSAGDYITDLDYLNGTIIQEGINEYSFQPHNDLTPGDYYMQIWTFDYSSTYDEIIYIYHFTIADTNDDSAPQINSIFQDVENPKIGQHVLFYANITDDLSHVKNPTFHYRIGSSGTFNEISMTNMFQASYCAPLYLDSMEFSENDEIEYYFSAEDDYNNIGIDNNNSNYYTFTARIQGPSVRINSPAKFDSVDTFSLDIDLWEFEANSSTNYRVQVYGDGILLEDNYETGTGNYVYLVSLSSDNWLQDLEVCVTNQDTGEYISESILVYKTDNDSPTITNILPGNNTHTANSSVTLTWDTNDAISGVEENFVNLDGDTWISTNLTEEYTFDSLAEGSHQLNIRVVDNVGNEETALINIFIDSSSLPALSILSPSDSEITSETVTITWTGSDSNGIDHYEVQLDSESWIDVG